MLREWRNAGRSGCRLVELPRLFATLLAVVTIFGVSQAQAFPDKHITLIVPYAAGGATDSIARVIAEHMSASLGKQVIVENVGGGAGSIGATRVARAAPDGYTIMLNQMGLATVGSLLQGLQFDASRDFTGVALVNVGPAVIVGHKDIPATTIAELQAWMKNAGRPIRIGHPGPGTYGHLSMLIFAQALGVKVDMIPYRGGGPALNDNLAGHIDMHTASLMAAAGHIRAGTLKGFGLTSRDTVELLPQVPSLVTAGLKEMDIPFWHAVFAPAQTPRAVIDRLNQAVRQAVVDPKVSKTFKDNGLNAYPVEQQTPEAATALLRGEIDRWREVIRANKIEGAQ